MTSDWWGGICFGPIGMAIKSRNRIATPLRFVLNPGVDFKKLESTSKA
jgi:hypothetical protein